MINNFPRKWDKTKVLPASQDVLFDWIPACAGMTAQA
jgi:hypothetical protein